jgi:hypothetical protein
VFKGPKNSAFFGQRDTETRLETCQIVENTNKDPYKPPTPRDALSSESEKSASEVSGIVIYEGKKMSPYQKKVFEMN